MYALEVWLSSRSQLTHKNNYILIKNSLGILCRCPINWEKYGLRRDLEYLVKFDGILPIQALKLLKIFNIKDKKDISWLYPNLNITGIMDKKNKVHRFYSDMSNVLLPVKLSDNNIEHEIYSVPL